MLDIVKQTYYIAAPDISPEEAGRVVDAAAERAFAKHSDFGRFLPAIEFLSGCVFTDHKRIPLDDYLETLYCAVKHGDYTRSWRAVLKSKTAPASEPVAG